MIRVLIKLILTLIVLAALVIAVGYWYVNDAWTKPLNFTEEIFTIEKGDSLRKISRRFHQQGITSDAYSLALLGRYEGTATQIKPGDYRLENGLNVRQVLEKFVKGDVVTYKVSLVEGLTFKQFRERLAAVEDLTQVMSDWKDEKIMQEIGAEGLHPEGQFFPDTYVFRAADTDLDVLKQAYQRMQIALDEAWENRDPDTPLKDKYQALILASIIEKETGKAGERPTIGGVFTNRLNRGMLLQTDPTIIYGLGDQFDGNLTRKHLDSKNNIYNTYQHAGLPPTPIAMPGLASLKAAVNPEKTDSLYFVAKGDGSHQFSKTYKEHQRAVNEYQIKRKGKG